MAGLTSAEVLQRGAERLRAAPLSPAEARETAAALAEMLDRLAPLTEYRAQGLRAVLLLPVIEQGLRMAVAILEDTYE